MSASQKCAAAVCAAVLVAAVVGQQTAAVDRHVTTLPLYVPKLPQPEVALLRSAADAERFAQAAWGRDEPQLHVDFVDTQVLALCWGPKLRSPAGGPLDLHLERAQVDGDVLRVVVRTALPFGPDRAEAAGDEPTLYPSLFVRAPRTRRVEVDVVGARCGDRARDFRQVATAELLVRVGPDAMPLRERMRQLRDDPRRPDRRAAPSVRVESHGDRQVLAVHWGQLPAAVYTLELTHALLVDGVARLTVRADARHPEFYSGPPEWWPQLRVEMPAADKVLLDVVRTGAPLDDGDAADFQPRSDDALVVTVDRSRVRR